MKDRSLYIWDFDIINMALPQQMEKDAFFGIWY